MDGGPAGHGTESGDVRPVTEEKDPDGLDGVELGDHGGVAEPSGWPGAGWCCGAPAEGRP